MEGLIYLAGVFGDTKDVAIIILFIVLIILLFVIPCFLLANDNEKESIVDGFKEASRYLKWVFIALSVAVFVPSKKDFYLMFIVSEVSEIEDIKKLPPKISKILNKIADKYLEEEK
jgi:hypothetical protein